MTEEQFLSWLLELAARLGWKSAHVGFPAKYVAGNKIVPDARGRGFPDVVLVRGGRLIFAELKGDHGRVEPEQAEWLDVLRDVATAIIDNSRSLSLRPGPGVEVYLWRPGDRSEVERVLR